MHRIVASKAIKMIDIRLDGVLSLADVSALELEYLSLFQSGFSPGYRLLADISGLKAQPQDSVAALMKMAANMPKASSIAVLTGSPLVRMQLGRVMQQPYLRMVADRQEALAWLTRGVEPSKLAA